MELISLGSSSGGNCHILYSNGVGIMLDCGINFNGLNHFLNEYNVKYILLSHCHNDHILGLKNEQVNDIDFKIFGNDETIDFIKDTKYINKIAIEKEKKYKIDDLYDIFAFEVPHDAKNFGYVIYDKKKNVKTLYLTDIGFIDNIVVKDIDNFIIECNYDENDYNDEEINSYKYKRSHGIYGHLSLQGCANFLNRSVNINTRNVILVHISKSNNDYKKNEKELKNELKNNKIFVKAINNRIVNGDFEITKLIDNSLYDNIVFEDVEFI